ncbi:hypothetical protein BDZ85DRAFT_296200 [Elsinoe ampelina]|uniref:Zn(2)-C6 fungal-type domain-containing protein n=1 Tax=Elsinoe ampelina TaxID=302913 RepID=A0A6A6GBH1_9PEZI|nr:hypothetical protein BDZ85DRAFT_296200 [Elsinoe ampelina]
MVDELRGRWVDAPPNRIPIAKRRGANPAAVACNACRKRKHKCSHDRPTCTACQDLGKVCVYDVEPGYSRHQALKQKQKSQQDELAEMHELFDRLRRLEEDEGAGVLRSLRSGAQPQDLLASLRSGSFRAQRHLNTLEANIVRFNLAGILSDPGSKHQLRRLFAAAYSLGAMAGSGKQQTTISLKEQVILPAPTAILPGWHKTEQFDATAAERLTTSNVRRFAPVNLALNLIPFERWTSVVVDRTQMVDILSIYFSWWHPTYRLFDEERFIDHLINGVPDPPASCLFNACCSIACAQYRNMDPTCGSLLPYFHQQAKASWSASLGQTHVRLVSAAGALCIPTYLLGEEDLALGYMTQGYQIATRLGLFSVTPREVPPAGHITYSAYRELSIAAWGLFNLSASTSLHHSGPPMIARHPSYHIVGGTDNPRRWVSWPRAATDQSFQANGDVSYSALSQLIVEFCNLRSHFRSTDKRGFQMSLIMLQHLLQWSSTQPDSQLPANNYTPHNTHLYIIVHSIIMECFRPYKASNRFAAQLFQASMTQVRTLLQRMVDKWDDVPLPSLSGLPRLAHEEMLRLQQGDKQAAHFMTLACEYLYRYAEWSPFALRMLEAILLTAIHREIQLPARLQAIMVGLKAKKAALEVAADDIKTTFSIALEYEQGEQLTATATSLLQQVKDLAI